MSNSQNKKLIFFLYLAVLYIFFLVIDKSFSPDYIAYFHRGHNSGYYLEKQFYYAPLFNLILNLLWNSKLKYHSIVNVIYTLNFFFFSLSILNYSKYFSLFRNKKFYIIFGLFIVYSILIVFEFFTIRLRAGLSLSLILLSFSFLLDKKKYLFIIFLISSLLVHTETSISFMYVSVFLVFFSKKKIKKKYIKEIFIFLMTPIIIFFLSYIANYFSIRNDVGILVKKPLNLYRIILYIIPIFLFVYYDSKSKFIFTDSSNYLTMYNTSITFLCISILFVSASPIIQFAGEDISRLFTVFTFPLIYLIMSKKVDNFLLLIWSYLIAINFILFFKNFVYLIL